MSTSLVYIFCVIATIQLNFRLRVQVIKAPTEGFKDGRYFIVDHLCFHISYNLLQTFSLNNSI